MVGVKMIVHSIAGSISTIGPIIIWMWKKISVK